jgi:ABC-type polysaccharide/polyol phosphate transport system ATPase subunit
MAHIMLGGVRADYELLSVLDYNLKRRVLGMIQRTSTAPVRIAALDGIDLDVRDGARVGLVGANGAGKSTLLAVMAGVLPPTSGSVEVHGRVLALLGGAAEGLDQEASGRDNIVSIGVQLGETPAAMRKRIDDVVEFSGLAARIDHPVYSYSTGMQTRLRFSILTSLRPDILLIDEGIGTADAEFARRADARLREFLSSAGILILASHGDDLLRSQCETAVWIHQGRVREDGELEGVLAKYHEGGAYGDAPPGARTGAGASVSAG